MKKKSVRLTPLWLGLLTFSSLEMGMAQGHITKADLGTGVTAKFQIINPTRQFGPDTPKIYCAWKIEGAKPATAVRGVWIAEDVGKAAPHNFKIDEATFTPPVGAPSYGSFALSKPNKGFPLGQYRLEIYLGSTLATTVPFTVKAR